MLLACTPTSVSDAEKKGNVQWLQKNGSGAAVAALGRLADEDKSAQAALESLARETENGKVLEGGASGLDVYLAVWTAVERKEDWAKTMMTSALADPGRMSDAASSMKRGSPALAEFVTPLEGAIGKGCDRCADALASASGPAARAAIERRLKDAQTRDTMCAGVGSENSSKDARGVFTSSPVSSRDAPSCAGAASRLAARDDDVLAWVGQTGEPGLLRAVGEDEAMPCDKTARVWSTVLTTRDRASYPALAIPLGKAVHRCAKELDKTLSVALGEDVPSEVLATSAIDPVAASKATLPLSCAAIAHVEYGSAPPPTKARAAEIAARCR